MADNRGKQTDPSAAQCAVLHEDHSRALTSAWLVLCVLTLMGAWLSRGNGFGVAGGVAAGAAILLLALLKLSLILHYYMELGRLPRAWRVAFAVWLVGLFSAMLVFYVLGGSG